MGKLEYFDYRKVAKEIKVPDNILREIEDEVKKEFPRDRMMYELHVLRAIKSKCWQKDSEKKKIKIGGGRKEGAHLKY